MFARSGETDAPCGTPSSHTVHDPFSMTPARSHFLDQAQDPSIRDPMLNEPLQPAMVKAGEVVAEIRVEHPVHLPRA